jgi:hypothetical protein
MVPAWHSWQQQPWTAKQTEEVVEDLKIRGLHVNVDNEPAISERIQTIAKALNLVAHKPTLIIFTGVAWDANTSVKSDAFDDMYTWVFETIDWFRKHPEFQLIIRVHPAENIAPMIAPKDRTKFMDELAKREALPDNIFIIKPEDKMETYDAMHLSDVGSVYMSTTGLEYACLGKPLLAIGPVHYSGKGFSYEPRSKEEYFHHLHELLKQSLSAEDKKDIQQLAMKYWYLYAFHGSVVTGLFETNQKIWLSVKRGIDDATAQVKALTVEDLLPGANPQIDYICDAIIQDLPIMGENRWPPRIKEEYCK